MFFDDEINILKEKGLYREFKTIKSSQSKTILIDEKPFINFSSNNYLDLADNSDIKKAIIELYLGDRLN